MSEPSMIGRNLRQRRGDRGLSQEALAEAADVSVDVISKLEQGRRQTARITTLSKLASALDIEISQLIDKRERLGTDRDGGSVLAVRDVLLSPELLPGLDADDTGDPTPLDQLEQSAIEARRRFWAGEFGELLAMLPGLIGEARASRPALGPPAARPLALAYCMAAAVMAQLGRTDLGIIAAERAVVAAHDGDDELLWAQMHGRYTKVLHYQGRYQQAADLATDMARRIEPSFRDGDLHLAVWGDLLLKTVAPTVALGKDPQEHLRLAGAAAERLGRRVITYDFWFDSSSVAMQATYGYSTLKRPGKALEAARRIRPDDLSGIWRGAHLMDVAQAHLDQRQHRTAATTLLEAQAAASPVWFRHQRIARSVTTEIREREHRLSPATRTLVRALDLAG